MKGCCCSFKFTDEGSSVMGFIANETVDSWEITPLILTETCDGMIEQNFRIKHVPLLMLNYDVVLSKDH